MRIKVGKKFVGDNCPCFIIAEVGSNHNQSLKMAKKLIDVASESGADAVKFQSIKYSELYLPQFPAPKEIRKLYPYIELPEKWHSELKRYAQKNKILFLSTPTYYKAIDLLERINVSAYKIGSPQTKANLPLVKHAAETKKPIFLATGYCTQEEIKRAVNICLKEKNKKIILLHCVSKYPVLPGEVNLEAMGFLRRKFKLLTGFSDHTLGYHITLAAVSKGACVIEKHITLSRKLKGPDHAFAIEPKELKEMIAKIREVEKSMGDGKRNHILKQEKKNASYVITRLIAKRGIKKGEVLKESMLDYKRTSYGILANDFEKVLGKRFIENVKKGIPLQWKHLK